MAIRTQSPDAALKERFKPTLPVQSPMKRAVEVAPVRESIRLTLPVPPSVNRLYSTTKEGLRVKSAEGRAYAVAVTHAASAMGCNPFLGSVGVRVRVFRPRKSGDIDNYQKALFDCLKGACWIDDKQIIYTESHRGDDADNPRVEVEVWEVPDG